MPKNNNSFSLESRNLRYKLSVAFSLMSILPLLVCMHLVYNYILPNIGLKLDIAVELFISIFIAVIGFFLVKKVFDRVVSVSREAKMIASGDLNRVLKVEQPDEVGFLGDSLNQLTQRIRSNMDELKSYGERTTQINLEIQKRVIVLSSLLQISSLISQGQELDEILTMITEKARFLADSEMAYLFLRQQDKENFHLKAADGINAEGLSNITISEKDKLFASLISENRPVVVDNKNELPTALATEFSSKFGLSHTLAFPVYLKGRVVAILGIGNGQKVSAYQKDDLELMDIFAKQVAIAIENDLLTHRVEKLEIKDALTGLYNEKFIHHRLDEEIKRAIAYQRPCGYILIDIDNFKKYYDKFGSLYAENTLKKIAYLVNDSISEIDRAGRVGDDEFAVVLPEKNKRQAQKIAEEIREKIEFAFKEEQEPAKKITVSAGVSENPLDGIKPEELTTKARELVNLAKRKGRNCVVGMSK